jgi:ferrous iron transport protein B
MTAKPVTLSEKPVVIAIAGNPNTGKTTLFNTLTGSRAQVGNYPGITVEKRTGPMSLPHHGPVSVVDIPGTYSFVARTAEEQIAIDALLGISGQPVPDALVVCVDASQAVRSSYLALQALEFGLPVIIAMTMMDEAGKAAPDPICMGERLGCDVIPLVASEGKGVTELTVALDRLITRVRSHKTRAAHWSFSPSPWLREKIATVLAAMPESWPAADAMALWALSSIEAKDDLRGIPPAVRQAALLSPEDQKRLDDEVICGRFAFLDKEIAPLVQHKPDRKLTHWMDQILIHPTLGFLLFLLFMAGLFEALFWGADPLIGVVEGCFLRLEGLLKDTFPDTIFTHFLADGLLGGVGAVLVFLPQIMLLFFLLGLLEDSGYLARVAYIMDRPMRAMNMHGRAFIPMLSGFACAVPAIMATRTMERRRDRLLAMMVIPLVTCSARLPVYTLIVAALFPASTVAGVISSRGLILTSLYLFGMLSALGMAWVLSHLVPPLRARRLPFVIELPPYRLPRLRDVALMVWHRTRRFLVDAGPVIVICSIVLWALLDFPRVPNHPSQDFAQRLAHASVSDRTAIEQEFEAERLQQSYAGRLGQSLSPILEPLGFDWKIGIGLIGAFAAREVFVATMGVVYGLGSHNDENSTTLRERLKKAQHPDGTPLYTPLVGLSLLIFFALACQCTGTLAAVRRETGTWRWPLFLFMYTTTLAWVASFVVFQFGRVWGA